jgi:hypothetical protein
MIDPPSIGPEHTVDIYVTSDNINSFADPITAISTWAQHMFGTVVVSNREIHKLTHASHIWWRQHCFFSNPTVIIAPVQH